MDLNIYYNNKVLSAQEREEFRIMSEETIRDFSESIEGFYELSQEFKPSQNKEYDKITITFFDGSDATKEALKTIFAESAPGHTADLTAVSTHLSTYLQLKKRMKELEEELNLQQAYITEFMADAEKGSVGNISVSFKTQSRRNFDRELYETENGPIADKYFKVSTSRPFKVTQKKESKK